jgi:hypothetical protein
MEKKVIYSKIEDVSTPVTGTIIFRLKGRTGEKFEKDSSNVVTKVKLSIADSVNASHEYFEIEKIYDAIKKEGPTKIINLIYAEASTEQKIRIANAIDSRLSFYLAVQVKNIELAKFKLEQILSDNAIVQEDYDLVLYYLDLLKNSY